MKLSLTTGAVAASLAVLVHAAESPPPDLPFLDLNDPSYRTPRAGEGFVTEVLGREARVEPRDRRSVSAWDLGFSATAPGIPHLEVLPFGSFYLWRRPDELSFFRATLVGFYDEVFYSRSAPGLLPLEGVLTFENYTVPIYTSEVIDGFKFTDEQLLWGYVRGGVGVGYRRQLPEPGHNDNMFAVSLLLEPGYLFFDKGAGAEGNFVEPSDTFEGRLHLRLRLDRFERNLLELPHTGFNLGADAVGGLRSRWRDWGLDGREDGKEDREFAAFSAHISAAGPVPRVASERHRLLGSLHAGWGDDLDRFSGFRLGGGPEGEEYESAARPIIPGAMTLEYATDRYATLIGEYRWEPIFFVYLSARTSVAWLNRKRFEDRQAGVVKEEDDVLFSIGGRITSGFFFETRLQLDYNYSTGVLRRGEYGAHEVTVHVSRSF